MKLIILSLVFLFPNFADSNWAQGKLDSKGNLIIVKLENKANCRNQKQHEVISVDMDWSILLRSNSETEMDYYIFNNISKQIFKTTVLDEFIVELKNIPDSTTIRQIEKCTIPFSYLIPEEQKNVIKEAVEKKQCILEERIMYCYCCAEKIDYKF